MNTQDRVEPSVRERIEKALTIFPADVAQWHKSRFAVDIDESESWPCIRIQVHANRYASPKVAVYLREVQPLNIAALLAEHDALTQSQRAEIERLLELLAGCRTVFALALDNGKNEQYASLETRRGSFIHCVKLMQDLDAALTPQPTKDLK